MKTLEWREQDIYGDKRWVASNDMLPSWTDNYEIDMLDNGEFQVWGLMKNLRCPNGERYAKTLAVAKAHAEGDYQRRQRAEAWREYTETHDIPGGTT